MAFGRRGKKNDDINRFIEAVRNAHGRSALDSLESELANLESQYPPNRLAGAYSALAAKFHEFGLMDKSYFYATKGNDRDLIAKLLKESGRCEELARFVKEWHDSRHQSHLLECYYKSGDYKNVLSAYEEVYSRDKNPRVLYYGFMAALNTGNREEMDKIRDMAVKDLGATDYYYNIILGKHEEILGNYKHAVVHYDEALKIKNTNEARFALARAYYYAGEVKKAEAIVKKLPQASEKTRSLYALIYAKQGKVKDALGIIDSVLSKGDDVDALLAKALIMSEHDIGGYETYIDSVLYHEPYNPIALEIYARAKEKSDPEEARKSYEKILKINPKSYRALLGLARISEGKVREKYARQVLEINSECVEAKLIIAEFDVGEHPEQVIEMLRDVDEVEAHYYLAYAYFKTGKNEEAELHIRRALSADPDNVKYKFLLARLISGRKKEEAESLIRDVLKAEPENKEAKRILAGIIYKEHPEEALALLEKQEDYESQWLRVKIYKILDRPDDAKRELEKLLKKGGDVEEYLALAEVSEKEDAIEILNNLLKKHPDNSKARLMLAKLIVDMDPERAISLIRDFEGPEAMKIMGLAYLQMGKYGEAYDKLSGCVDDLECKSALVTCGVKIGNYEEILPYAREVAALSSDKDSLWLLGEIYEHVDIGEAYEVYRRLTMKFPSDVDAWKKLVEFAKKTGHIDELLTYYDRIYELTHDYRYLMSKTKILEDRKDYEALYSVYSQILTEHPELEEIEDKRDALLIKMGRYEDLIQLADYWTGKRGTKAAKGYYLRALAYMNLGDYEKALENAKESTRRSRSTKYKELEAEILYKMGRAEEAYEIINTLKTKTQDTMLLKAKILRAVGHAEEAEKILKTLEEAGVKEASLELGKIYADLGNYDEALKYLEASARNFDDLEIYVLGSKIGYEAKKYMKALWFINGGLRKNRNSTELWVYRVLALLNIGEKEDALRAVEHLLSIDDRPEHRLLKAKVLNSLNRVEESLGILGTIDLDFMGISAKEERAWALFMMGEYEKSISLYRSLGNAVMVARNLFAMRRYREILKLAGDDPELLEIKGDASLKLGNNEEAKKYYGLASDAGNRSASKKLANLLYEEHELNNAYALYELVGDADSTLRAADIMETLGQYGEAANLYRKYFSMTGDSSVALRAVRIYVRLNMYREAKEVLELLSNTEEIIKLKAEVYYHLGEYIKAVEVLRLLEGEDFDVRHLLGDIYFAMGQPHRAKEYYLKALEDREDMEVLKSLARTYEVIGDLHHAAEAYFKCDDDESFHRAERIFKDFNNKEKLRQLYEKRLRIIVDVDAMKNLAEIYIERGDYQRAYSLYSSVKDYEFSAEVLTRIGMLEIYLGDYPRAEETLKRSLEIEELSDTYYYLGLLYSKQGRYDLAREMYERSERPETTRELCRLAIFTGRADEALKTGGEIIETINDGESWYLYGRALMMAGDYENALKALKLAEEKGYEDVNMELGEIYLKLGQYDRAVKALEGVDLPDAGVVRALSYATRGQIREALETLNGLDTGDALKYRGDALLLEGAGGRENIYFPTSAIDKKRIISGIESYRDSIKKERRFSDLKWLYNNLGIAYILVGELARGTEYLEMAEKDMLNLMAAYILLGERASVDSLIGELKIDYSQDERYWDLMGVYNAIIEKYDDAMDALSHAEDLVRNAYEREVILYNRALLLIRLGMYQGALDILKSVKLPDALLLRTYVYLKLGKYEEGKENLDLYRGEDLRGNLSYIKSYMDMKLERYDDAINNINAAITKNPELRDYWMLKGIILSKMGELDAAERIFGVARHMEDGEDVRVNMGAVMILRGKHEVARSVLSEATSRIGRFNLGCALAHLGDYESAAKEFMKVYKESGDKKALYYLHLASINFGEPPDLKEDKGIGEKFNLAELLMSSYNVHVIIRPYVEEGHLNYSVIVKNLSGDTVSPFTVHPVMGSIVTVNKTVGPIRPYEEAEVKFKTTKTKAELVRESGLVPGKHAEIVYELYSKGVGIVEEIRIKNLTKYSLKDIHIGPVLLEGFESWYEDKKIDEILPGSENVVKFALFHIEHINMLEDFAGKYEEFVPEYSEPEFKIENFDYKVMFTLHPFEFVLPTQEVQYDAEKVKKSIKKERRRMLVKNVGKYTEAIVSVER